MNSYIRSLFNLIRNFFLLENKKKENIEQIFFIFSIFFLLGKFKLIIQITAKNITKRQNRNKKVKKNIYI